jgi:hypothetical protein
MIPGIAFTFVMVRRSILAISSCKMQTPKNQAKIPVDSAAAGRQ